MWKLGQKIIIDHCLIRVKRIEKSDDWPGFKRFKEWQVVKTPLKEVVIVGRRTLSNGTTFSEEGMNFFEPKEYFEGLLVADSLNKKPFLFDTRQGWHYEWPNKKAIDKSIKQ